MLRSLASLSRDSRDCLFLLLVIAWVTSPLVAHLPLWSVAWVLGMLIWRGWLAWRSRPLPARFWRLLLLCLGVAATAWNYRTLHGRDAGVTLLVILLSLKTLELRARRDALVVFFLGFFVMLTSFFFSQSLLSALAMLLGLLGLLTGLVNSHRPTGRPALTQSAKTALRLMVLGAPLMLLLFLLFPRFSPIWGNPDFTGSARSGLSSSMRVGSITQLALDDSVAMRVRFEGTQPLPQELYFRGPVLTTYDGTEWTSLKPSFPQRYLPQALLEVSGPSLRYEVTLEPSKKPWLMTLDAAPDGPQSAGSPLGRPRMTRELQWLSDAPINDVLRYRAQSYPSFQHGPLRAVTGLQDYLELPPGSNPRTLALAIRMLHEARGKADQPQAQDLVNATLAMLRSGGYRYTLEPGPYGQHTADEFWFDRKEGFCEHIASSFVVLMRALGIPARIVTGYQGGDYNPRGNYWVVRQSDAHAWSEVWLAGRGWVRVDPTGAVSPGRIGTLQRLAQPGGVMAAVLGAVNPVWSVNLRAYWDTVNYNWQQWVINYTQGRQSQLLQTFGLKSAVWGHLLWLLIVSSVLASLAWLAWTLWLLPRKDPWLKLLATARHKLRRAGLVLPPHSTPREMANLLRHNSRLSNLSPVQRSALVDWLLHLEAQRYGKADEKIRSTDLRRLVKQAKQLKWPI